MSHIANGHPPERSADGSLDRSGWRRLAPPSESDPAPAPTYWPAGAALGTVVLLWGTLTSPVLLGVGGALLALSLVRWIGEMLHDA